MNSQIAKRKFKPYLLLLVLGLYVLLLTAASFYQNMPWVNYQWHTFYGTTVEDEAFAVKADNAGNVYVAGFSEGSWLGDEGESPIHPHSGNKDIMLLKLSNNGEYLWHTFYGNNAKEDEAKAMALDGEGNIYLVGYSGASWLGDSNKPPLNYCSGLADLIVVKLSPSGNLLWHTCIGGAGNDEGRGVSISQNGNSVFITGVSEAPWLGPGGQNPKHAYPDGGHSQLFVLKLTSSGTYQWHTFYGGGWLVGGYSFASDADDNIVVTGYSTDGWAGDGNTLPKHHFTIGEPSVDSEIMVLKLNSEGNYLWHTFYGSNGNDYSDGVAIDTNGQIYLAGNCEETWNGDLDEPPLRDFAETDQGGIVVMRLDEDGEYQWHTFYGDQYGQAPSGLTLDQAGNIYITGGGGFGWYGDNGEEPYNHDTSGWPVVVFSLSNTGHYRWHTFYGGTSAGYDVAVDHENNVFIAGRSMNSFQGDNDHDPLHPYTGNTTQEVVVIKLAAYENRIYLPLIN